MAAHQVGTLRQLVKVYVMPCATRHETVELFGDGIAPIAGPASINSLSVATWDRNVAKIGGDRSLDSLVGGEAANGTLIDKDRAPHVKKLAQQ